MAITRIVPRSRVLEVPAAESDVARRHFEAKLALETDPSDVHDHLKAGLEGLVVVDARAAESYAKGHVPGAINLPYRTIDAATAGRLDRSKTYVTYCSGLGCNASTKAAARLAAHGLKVKEMLGGLHWWREVEGYPVATGTEAGSL